MHTMINTVWPGRLRLGWLCTLLVMCCSSWRSASAAPTSAVIAQDADLSSLQEAVMTAALATVLDGTSPSTLFAPNNAAFAVANQDGLVTKLLQPEWIAHLTALLAYHVVPNQSLASGSITDGLEIPLTLHEDSGALKASVVGGVVSLSGDAFADSKVIAADIATDQGFVHKVDKIFTPTFLTKNVWETAQTIEGFDLALPFITIAGLEPTLRNEDVTLFGPSEAAFTSLPTEFITSIATDTDALKFLLNNHITSGIWPKARLTDGLQITMLSGLTYTVSVEPGIDGAILIGELAFEEFDQLATNGVAHRMGGVFLPPEETPTVAPTLPKPEETATGVALTISQEADLSTLEKAMIDTGLDSFLGGDGPFTVFTPVDAAFTAAAANPDGFVDKVLMDTDEWRAQLRELVKFHVNQGRLVAADITNGLELHNTPNLFKLQPLEPYVASVATDGTVSISGTSFPASKVVAADLTADNGVVHKVDSLFIPTTLTRNLLEALSDTAAFYGGFGSVLGLITQAGLEETLRSETVTFFAPSDAAIEALSPSVLSDLNADSNRLRQVLEGHIVQGNQHQDKLTSGTQLTSLAGTTLTVEVGMIGKFKEYSINGAYIGPTDIVSRNGLAHIIDTVLGVSPSMGRSLAEQPGEKQLRGSTPNR